MTDLLAKAQAGVSTIFFSPGQTASENSAHDHSAPTGIEAVLTPPAILFNKIDIVERPKWGNTPICLNYLIVVSKEEFTLARVLSSWSLTDKKSSLFL